MNKKLLIGIVIAIIVVVGGWFYFSGQTGINNTSQKNYVVGILNGYDYFGGTTDGFKSQMTELGYIEGKNITYEVIKSDVDTKKYDEAIQKFIKDKVDLIVAYPTEASIEAKKLTVGTKIPVVFTNANIEGVNLINSISEPGGNITGVRFPGPDIALKRLEVLLEISPTIKTIILPYLKGYPNVPPQLVELHKLAAKDDITILEAPVATPDELKLFLNSVDASKKKIDGILTIPEVVSAVPGFTDLLGKYAQDHRIPFGGTLLLKKDGYQYETLFNVFVDTPTVGKQAAVLANKIFRGIDPGTIPVVSADSTLILNYRLAKEQGFNMSESLLSRANQIIR